MPLKKIVYLLRQIPLKKALASTVVATACSMTASAGFAVVDSLPQWQIDGRTIITAPKEGLWSVGTGWENDWISEWTHISPSDVTVSGDWTVISGKKRIREGEMTVRDSYRQLPGGLTQVIRRYQWNGPDTLRHATLSVRLHMAGDSLQPFLPGIIIYGNPNGAKVNPGIIPVYSGAPGEFAIFEDHRYPMPFAMLESSAGKYAAAVHTTPSPVRGAVLSDQWWSLGVESGDGASEFVLYSGPIGYNKEHSVAKALQRKPMKYTDTYLDIEPGRVVEKEFFVELYHVDEAGTGFQRPVHTSIAMHRPFDADRFPSFDEIIGQKYKFALSRWIEGDTPGFNMYDPARACDIVMGWCGQADSPGFALQALQQRIGDNGITDKVQRSLDFLAGTPVNADGTFPVGYRVADRTRHGGDHVSCGQALYNFAKAVELGRDNPHLDTSRWEKFLKMSCDRIARRILDSSWNPRSTAEGFYIAPLAISSELFKNDTYRRAADRIAAEIAAREFATASYWGGTLDATCEDKEGAWAAFQGFLELYERCGDKKYLKWATHAMDVILSYVVVWDISLPPGRLADHNFKSTGWTAVSPQNQHLDVYGVLIAPEIYRMGQILGNDSLKLLSQVMYRSCFQLTDPFGSQGEQIQQNNYAQRGDMTDVHKLRGGYSENWTVFWITAHFLNAAARFELLGALPPMK